jgi:transcriptional regulator with XRE-family HTH domain
MDVNAKKIKTLRTQKGWTQQHLADACAISLRTVQRVERYGNASQETVLSLAAVFEVLQLDLVVPEEPLALLTHPEKNQNKQLFTAALFGAIFGALIMFMIK